LLLVSLAMHTTPCYALVDDGGKMRGWKTGEDGPVGFKTLGKGLVGRRVVWFYYL